MRAWLGADFVDWYCALKRMGEIDTLSQLDLKDDSKALAAETEMYGYFM